ncbi:DUF2516 family protein [Nocardioides sp. SR21]|uniref:DUF2516 family protein n=1 Tax=Nocardioides sp. SR21 TaxID=2919501 RepID=UPI001FA965CD|nr:DUF2516 family protein [Nocardioides sp. SR21]
MLHVLEAELNLMLFVELVILGVKIFALVNCLMYSAESYSAANKLSKAAWAIILGVGLAAQIVLGGVIGLISLAFTVAALVYLADVRPALASLTRR